MKTSVVIPTYNGLHLLQKHLPAVMEAMREQDQLIIVDDASSDKTVSWLVEQFNLEESVAEVAETKQWQSPAVKLIQNETNQRFAISANRGVEVANNHLIFLLNNDVSPEPDVLDHLIPYFEDRTVFGVGCLEYEDNQQGEKSGKNQLFFRRGLFMHSKADEFDRGPTAWVSGGSGIFDRHKWLELDGFDERFYPAYWEDIDLSHRARQKSWQVLFEPKAVVYHKHESTNQDVFGQKRMEAISWEHAFLFTRLHANWWQKALYYLWKPYWLWKKRSI